MEVAYIDWNFTNWITIVLMAAIGFMALSLIMQFWHNRTNNA